MTDRQVSQVIAEVSENPTTVQRRVSQVVLEVSHSPAAAPATVAGVGRVPEIDGTFPVISGMVFRLHAPDVSGADNDPVGSWPDASGNGHTFTGSGSTRPLLKMNIAGPNTDKPGVLFDGSDDYLDGGDLQSVFPSAATVFIVYQVVGGDTNWALARNNGSDGWYSFGGTGYPSLFRTSRVANYPSSGVPSSGRHTYTIKSSASTYQSYLDGTANSAQSASYADGDTYFYIGGGAPSDPQGQNRAFSGYIFEVIAYNTALSGSDINLLEAWAEAYYFFGSTARPSAVAGVGAVPAPTVYATAGPNVVAGIGAVPAATAVGGTDVTATPATVAGIGAVPAPTAIGSGAGEAAPNVVIGTGTVPAPTAGGASLAVPAAVAGVGAVPAATLTGTAVAAPGQTYGVGSVLTPSVFAVQNSTAGPATVAGIGRVYRPSFPSTTDPGGGGTGGSGGGGTSEITTLWRIELQPADG